MFLFLGHGRPAGASGDNGIDARWIWPSCARCGNIAGAGVLATMDGIGAIGPSIRPHVFLLLGHRRPVGASGDGRIDGKVGALHGMMDEWEARKVQI
jgi:hypothetical protein